MWGKLFWLEKYSAKLNYNMVYDIKKENPQLEIIINGGITKVSEISKIKDWT